MKKILSILLCLALLGCAALAEPAEVAATEGAPAVGERLGFALLKELYGGGNRVISPASLTLALGMAAAGASGETLSEILAAMDAEDAGQLALALPAEIQSANAAFVAPGLSLKPDYAARLDADYAAERFEIDGAVVEKVNSWVEVHTGGLIDRLLSDAPDPATGLMLVNAIAMDSKWAKPFEPYNTIEDDFHAPDGDVRVEMMYQRENFDYAEKDGLQIVRLPYAAEEGAEASGDAGGLEMWIVLPGEGAGVGLEGALDALAEEGMAYLRGDAAPAEVDLFLPKMDVSDENILAQALQALGVKAAFGDGADFSAASDANMKIAEILQKARVQLDEEGTRAAAATAVIMECMAAAPVESPVEMRVDRPFAFVIADAARGAVCFAGVIENPAA